MPKRKFRIMRSLRSAGAGAVGGGLIAALPLVLLSLGALLGAAIAAIVVVAMSATGSYFDVSVLVGAAALGAMVGAATGFLGSVVAKHTSAPDIHDERRGR
jgi:hypothetical protein